MPRKHMGSLPIRRSQKHVSSQMGIHLFFWCVYVFNFKYTLDLLVSHLSISPVLQPGSGVSSISLEKEEHVIYLSSFLISEISMYICYKQRFHFEFMGLYYY
jgi:hypothetical protein